MIGFWRRLSELSGLVEVASAIRHDPLMLVVPVLVAALASGAALAALVIWS